MSECEFTHKAVVGKYEVQIESSGTYGYFEHEDFGDEAGGGLWFEGKELTDYDGMATLPKDVIAGVRQLGFAVGKEFE